MEPTVPPSLWMFGSAGVRQALDPALMAVQTYFQAILPSREALAARATATTTKAAGMRKNLDAGRQSDHCGNATECTCKSPSRHPRRYYRQHNPHAEHDNGIQLDHPGLAKPRIVGGIDSGPRDLLCTAGPNGVCALQTVRFDPKHPFTPKDNSGAKTKEQRHQDKRDKYLKKRCMRLVKAKS